jgi:UMF1 family MFS transporter
VYFIIFALPAFFWIKEEHRPQDKEGKSYFRVALDRIKNTLQSVKDFKEFIKFMVALLIYNDGIIAALTFAGIIGTVIYGLSGIEMIIFVIIVQVTNVIGALMYGILSEKIGLTISGYAMAGVQSLSRTMVSVFAPEGKSAEFYGFFSLAGRTSSIIGPGVMGLAATGISTWVMSSLVKADLVTAGNASALVVSEQIGHRFALITLVLFLLVGLMPLLFVNEAEGRRAAKAASVK